MPATFGPLSLGLLLCASSALSKSVGVEHPSSVEVVLAHYKENLTWIGDTKHSRLGNGAGVEDEEEQEEVAYRIYSKGEGGEALLSSVPSSIRASFSTLPNVGRESHTYLFHIVSRYHSLADWTVFSQAAEPGWGFRGHDSTSGHLTDNITFQDYLRPQPDGFYMPMSAAATFPQGLQSSRLGSFIVDYEGNTADICPGTTSWSPWWFDPMHPHVTLFRDTQPQALEPLEFYREHVMAATNATSSDIRQPLVLVFSSGARFAVSRSRIHSRPRSYYENLLNQLDSHKNPIEGFYLEAMWFDVFNPERLQGVNGPACDLPVSPLDETEGMSLQDMWDSVARDLSSKEEASKEVEERDDEHHKILRLQSEPYSPYHPSQVPNDTFSSCGDLCEYDVNVTFSGGCTKRLVQDVEEVLFKAISAASGEEVTAKNLLCTEIQGKAIVKIHFVISKDEEGSFETRKVCERAKTDPDSLFSTNNGFDSELLGRPQTFEYSTRSVDDSPTSRSQREYDRIFTWVALGGAVSVAILVAFLARKAYFGSRRSTRSLVYSAGETVEMMGSFRDEEIGYDSHGRVGGGRHGVPVDPDEDNRSGEESGDSLMNAAHHGKQN